MVQRTFSRRLYVGNLSDGVKELSIKRLFTDFGAVESVDIRHSKDIDGNIANTFAFVDISISEENLHSCLGTFSDYAWKGRQIFVNIAKESFLTRLQRERNKGGGELDHCGTGKADQVITTTPKKRASSDGLPEVERNVKFKPDTGKQSRKSLSDIETKSKSKQSHGSVKNARFDSDDLSASCNSEDVTKSLEAFSECWLDNPTGRNSTRDPSESVRDVDSHKIDHNKVSFEMVNDDSDTSDADDTSSDDDDDDVMHQESGKSRLPAHFTRFDPTLKDHEKFILSHQDHQNLAEVSKVQQNSDKQELPASESQQAAPKVDPGFKRSYHVSNELESHFASMKTADAEQKSGSGRKGFSLLEHYGLMQDAEPKKMFREPKLKSGKDPNKPNWVSKHNFSWDLKDSDHRLKLKSAKTQTDMPQQRKSSVSTRKKIAAGSFFFREDDQRLKDGVEFFHQPVDFDSISRRWPEERTRLKSIIITAVKSAARKAKQRTSLRPNLVSRHNKMKGHAKAKRHTTASVNETKKVPGVGVKKKFRSQKQKG